MVNQSTSFPDPNPVAFTPWMDRGLDSPLAPYTSDIKDNEISKAALRLFVPLHTYNATHQWQWPSHPEKHLITSTLEMLGDPSQHLDYKWIKSETPFILRIELLARALFAILNMPNIHPNNRSKYYIPVNRDVFAQIITFLEERVIKLEANQNSTVAWYLSKIVNAVKFSRPRKKVYHWERYAGEENTTIPIVDQITRLRAVILTFHACYCNYYKNVYMKDAVRLVKAVVHLKEAKLENAFDLAPTLKNMPLEKREEVANAPIYSGALKILEFIRSDTRPIAQEQANYLMEKLIKAYPKYKETNIKLEELTMGEVGVLKYSFYATELLIDPITIIVYTGSTRCPIKKPTSVYHLYNTAQKLIQEDNYVFRAQGSAPTQIDDSKGLSTENDSLPPSPMGNTGYGMGAGIGAGANDIPHPKVPS